MPTRQDIYRIPTYELRNKLDIDVANKKVYIKEGEISFKGGVNRKLIQKIEDVDSGDVISYSSISTTPIISE
ncbi:hypothetical protein C5137_28610 [Bacillus cereus]|uniref:hypothetical protein n=1 Tax=Bacillus cereus TaxID=1396 RepID=UPI001F5D07D4|nr:hypothetical protein [Bacillus cereus]MCI3150057.1 hypothetical protein [Bacillus cereus]